MGQPGCISLGQAVTPRGLVARPGYDRVTGPGSVTGLGLSREHNSRVEQTSSCKKCKTF